MNQLLTMLAPELVLAGVACILFLVGCVGSAAGRRVTPFLALLALLLAMFFSIRATNQLPAALVDQISRSIRVDSLTHYIRLLACGLGIILLLLAWPTNVQQTGNSALNYGADAGEFYGLFLLSLTGLLLTAIANDLIVLFLALELTSIPTYVMVGISRPRPAAQEAAVKYFFLGALSVALMLFGFSYMYGATGAINFTDISDKFRSGLDSLAPAQLSAWQLLGVVLVLLGLAFKMAAFPLHFYAGDVYEGAATPVTAFLAFVPKTAGFVALIKLLVIVGGAKFALPDNLVKLLWVMAAATMSLGNVLGLLQSNVKRVLAYSSIAHSGYMLVGVAALATAGGSALQGVLFYLAAYGIMNAGAFGVLMLLPGEEGSAQTFSELAGQGRRHVGLGLAMTVCCFSLIGMPLTVGFLGKVLLIKPAFSGGLVWLAIVLIINAAISAAYYLRIVATMFLVEPTGDQEPQPQRPAWSLQTAVCLGVILSVVGTLSLGTIPQAAQRLSNHAAAAARVTPAAPAAMEIIDR